jgi:uncharacterized protein CbrC (UPF0167 family)
MSLPVFRYHPDPIATGSVEPSEAACKACGQARGYVYVGPVYGERDDLGEAICPWCIADGSAHEKLDVEFVDPPGVGDYGTWEQVPAEVVEEVAYRTPGFTGWQQERWFTHCGDAAEFLAIAGKAELYRFGDEAVEAIRRECGYTGVAWDAYFTALNREGGPTAYVFRCRQCRALGGYSDCH